MAGFEFEKKPMIEICGKEYVCDVREAGFIEGVMRDFPRVMSSGVELKTVRANLNKALKKKDLAEMQRASDKALKVNQELLDACKAFIHGTIGVKEYEEIFAGRKENSVEHLQLAFHIFQFITEGRNELLQEYIDPPEGLENVIADITE